MNELLEEYNNKIFDIYLFNHKYKAQFYLEDNQLKINLFDFCDNEMQFDFKSCFKVINGRIDTKDITFFNFQLSSKSYDKDGNYVFQFRFNEFIVGYKYTNINNRKINKVEIEFYNIEDFTELPYYDYKKIDNPIFSSKCYDNMLNDKSVSIFIGHSFRYDKSSFNSNKIIKIIFKYNKCKKYTDIMADVYHFKAFLSLLSKRDIGIKKIKINKDGILFLNCIKFYENIPSNIFFKHYYNEFVFCFEDIKSDFSKIYTNFEKLFVDAFPIFDIYLDDLKYKNSSLNKFLNYTQILEYISKYYDNENAKKVWIKNSKPGNKNRPTLSDMIESMLIHVNFIWNFRKQRIYTLSRVIANGRNYYNHHNNVEKKLSNNQIIRIPYFLEDVILAYIYQYIGINSDLIKEKLIYNIHYSSFIDNYFK